MTSCDPKLEYEPSFNDRILTAQEATNFTVATGEKGIYCLAGEYQQLGLKITEGMVAGATGRKYFNIKQLVTKYPSLNTDKVKSAITRQSKRILEFEKILTKSKGK